MLTSYSGFDLGEDKLVPEGCHAAASQVPFVQRRLLGSISRLKELAADGVAGLDGGCHPVIDSVPQPGNRAEHLGLQLLYVI